ncbi:MAG: DUF6089 family protein [Saprospiraceae bacterium]
MKLKAVCVKCKIIFIVLLVISYLEVEAQKGYEIGGWVGTSVYHGDLNPEINFKDPGLSFGLIGRYNFNSRICFKTSLNYGFIKGNDADSKNNFNRNRNLNFQSHMIDLSPVIEFNFMDYVHGSRTKYFTPYLLGGANMFYFNPTTELDGEKYSLRKFGTEGQIAGKEYGLVHFGLVLGVGFKWDINYDYSINIEWSTRLLFTDYLDDVSTVYPDKEGLRARRGDIAVALSDRSLVEGLGGTDRQRGDSKSKDSYSLFGIGIVKYFGRIDCPEISKIK